MRSSSTRAGRDGRCRFFQEHRAIFQEDRPMKALALKELRELFGITAVALAAYLALVVSLMGAKAFYWVPGMPPGTHEVPFSGDEFKEIFTWVSVAFALTLGF